MKKIKHLKTKIYNHLMSNGKKKICEKVLLKSLKLIQKSLTKNHKNLIKLAFVNTAPIVNLKKKLKKKTKRKKLNLTEFPYIIKKQNRIFLALKSILKNSNNKELKPLGLDILLKQNILLNSQNKNNLIENKYNLYESVLKKKRHVLIKYRWA